MAIILCLETATTVCSVALFDNEKLLTYQEYHIEKSHSVLLPTLVETSLNNAGLSKAELNAVAISEGPGSYTGLRIGVSIAKGLCYALDIPLIAVNTLASMAAAVNNYNKRQALLCPMIDARRMEVYCGVFDHQNNLVLDVAPVIVDANSFSNLLETSEVWFFGDGASKCRELFSSQPNAEFVDDVWPSARGMGVLAQARFCSSKFEDIAYFEPFYLKEFRVTKPKVAV